MFGCLMAMGVLIHNAHFGSWHLFTRTAVLSLVALWVLVRPTSVFRVLALAVVYLGVFARELPRVMNHSMFLAIVIVTMALALLLAWRRRGDDLGAALFDRLAPALRVMVVLLYVFATVAKCNTDYYDPEISAALGIYHGGLGRIPGLPVGDSMPNLLIWGSLILEGGMAVCLAVPKLRILALVFGLPFHAFLGIVGHAPFSGFVPMLLWPFFADRFVPRFRAGLAGNPHWATRCDAIARWFRRPWAFPVVALVWVVPSALCTMQVASHTDFILGAQQVVVGVYLGYMAVVLGLLWIAVRGRTGATATPTPQPLHALLSVGIILLTSNALCPFLGLKTQSSFTMYSNLRTEGNEWNHSFYPRAMRVFGYQDRVVQLLDSSDPVLEQAAERRERWVWFELRRHLRNRPDASVVYELDGEVHDVRRAGDDPELGRGPGLLLRKALWFRPLEPRGASPFAH